jgi:PAS domain S-box-containing protein
MTRLPVHEFDRMLDDMDVCMYRSTVDGLVIQANHGFVRLMASDGSPKLAPMRIIREATSSADAGAFLEALRHGNRVSNLLSLWRLPNGGRVHVREHAVRRGAFVDGIVVRIPSTDSALRDLAGPTAVELLMQDLPGIVFRCDYDRTMRMRYVSEGATALTGFLPDELTASGFCFADLIHDDDIEAVRSEILAAVEKGTGHRIEYRLRTRDQRLLSVLQRGHAMLDIHGNVQCLQGYIVDVGEPQGLEQERTLMFEMSLDMLCMLDEQLRIIDCNPAMSDFLGVSPTALWRTPLTDVLHPEDGAEAMTALTRLFTTAAERSFVTRCQDAGGRLRHLWWQAGAVADGGKIYCIARDSTEQRQHEQSLRESEQRFRLLAENAQDLMYRYRLLPDRAFEYVNPAATAMTGYSPEEHYADPELGFRLVHPDDVHLLKEAMETSLSADPLQLRWIRKDGTVLWTEQVNVPIVNEDGVVTAIEGIARDITGRKRAEEAMTGFNEALEERVAERTAELNCAKEELETVLHAIAHDIRAPLRHIDGFLTVLRDDLSSYNISENAEEYLNILERSAGRMMSQLDALLDFARIGRQGLHHSIVSMTSIVDEVKHQLSPAASTESIEWRIGDLPPACCDPAMMYSVLLNLLGNAVKFSRCKQTAVISITGECVGNEHVYTVRDNGVGFDMRDAEKLFVLYSRLHTRDEYEGNGVGLALVRRILQLHGGWVNATGRPGRGATVTFALPATTHTDDCHRRRSDQDPAASVLPRYAEDTGRQDGPVVALHAAHLTT